MEKIVKISIKLRVLASGCSSVAGHRGGLHQGLMGAGATVGWGQQRGGAVGATVGGAQPIRTTLHTLSLSLQNSLSRN